MNERDFDKIFSDKLNDGKDFPRKKENWQKVAAQLDSDSDAAPIPIISERNKGFKRGLWGLLLLALLGSMSYQYSQMGDLKTQIVAFKNAPIVHDTIIQTQIIHSKDTIIKIIYLKEPTSQSITVKNNTPSVSTINFNENSVSNIEKGIETTFTTPSNSDINYKNASQNATISASISSDVVPLKDTDSLNKSNDITNNLTKTDPINTLNNPLDSLKTAFNTGSKSPIDSSFNNQNALKLDTINQKQAVHKPPLDTLEKALEKSPTIIKPKKGFKIQDFRVGVNAGYNWLLANVDGVKPSLWLGGTAEAAFNERWRASVSTDFSNYHLELKKNEDILNLPETPIIEPRFNLTKIETEYTGVAANLAVYYVLMPEKRIRPMLSIGYTLRYIDKYHTEFEFKDTQKGEELKIDLSSPSHIDNWWLLGGGVEMNISKRLEARLKMDYHLDFNHGKERLQYLLLRGGVYYKF